MKIVIGIKSNEGYSASQVNGIKVKLLKEMLEDFDDDDEIITYDFNNKYGANYGKLTANIIDEDDDEEDEEW